MTRDPDTLLRQHKALRERHLRLARALVRISASLDLDKVLREVVDSARAVTGARFGVVTTIDEKDLPHRFLTSGIEAKDHRRLAFRDNRRLLYEHFRELRRPVRVGDLASYLRTLGIDPAVFPGNTLQATPIRHQGVYLGSLFLVDKEGGRAFTDEDEELLVLFASQAAAAIANACAYRDELRERAKLEALVETAPVGVVLFDAGTGGLVSWNREAARIVEGLKMPDRPIERLLEIVTCRRANGFEVDLSKDPAMSDECRSGEALRNQEIVLSVPDGRSVGTLVNVTPIHAADGGVEFVVVTMQDLAPFEELERMRTEFLAIVSHELRTPLTSIKGSAGAVLDASPGFAPEEMLQFFRIINAQADQMSSLITDLLDAGRIASHGGRIRAMSGGEGQGTRFTFTVPVAGEARVDSASAPASHGLEGRSRQGPARERVLRERILVVDDDPQTLLYVRDALTVAGYHVLATGDHRELSNVIRAEKPHLVLLDLMLPGTDGIRLMNEVPELADRPVIFISAYGRDETIARALGAGAADYVVKPFSPTELTARVRAALGKHTEPEPFELGELAVDYERRRVTLAGRPVELTATEYEVLRLLSANAGRVLTYRSLLRQAWVRYPDRASPKLVHAVIKRLRRKLGEDAATATNILNERLVGYRMPAASD